MKHSSTWDRFPAASRPLLKVGGADVVERLGADTVAHVVADVLCGHNVRNATESLTRRRLALLNAALVVAYLNGAGPLNREDLLAARRRHAARDASAEERLVLLWTLGLTQKQVQNVLRSDDAAWGEYLANLLRTIDEVAQECQREYGPPGGLRMLAGASDELSWPILLQLLMAIGSQTLGIRGAEKSMYGKLFEKLVLTGVLSLLGFKLSSGEHLDPGTFRLSERHEKRESDATLLLAPETGIRFDIGFIGPGNTEISLDKVSRFEREGEVRGRRTFMSTVILVDRIGRGSRIEALAGQIGGRILQMSMTYWPQALGDEITRVFPGYRSPLAGLAGAELEAAIRRGVRAAPLARAVAAMEAVGEDEE